MSTVNALESTGCDKNLIGLGIRQPWVELILAGAKTIEVRSQPTKLRGSIYIYAAKKVSNIADAQSAADTATLNIDALPRGMVVGTVEIVNCRPASPNDVGRSCVSPELLVGQYAWELRNPFRFDIPVRPRFLPYGVWFYPFRARP